MDMDASKTDKLIAGAIAALPYRRPSAGFSARVLAEIAAAGEPAGWLPGLLKTAGLTVTLWAAALAVLAGRLVYSNLPELAGLFLRPGGLQSALNLLGARAALAAAKLAGAAAFIYDVAAAVSPELPAWYEVAVASLVCCAAIAALSPRRLAGAVVR